MRVREGGAGSEAKCLAVCGGSNGRCNLGAHICVQWPPEFSRGLPDAEYGCAADASLPFVSAEWDGRGRRDFDFAETDHSFRISSSADCISACGFQRAILCAA